MIRRVRLAGNADDRVQEAELLLLPPRSPHPDPAISGCAGECRLAARVRVDGLEYEVHQRGRSDLFVPLGPNSRGQLVQGPTRSTVLAAIEAAL